MSNIQQEMFQACILPRKIFSPQWIWITNTTIKLFRDHWRLWLHLDGGLYSLKPHPAWKEGEVPFCIILCCCRQKILSRGTYSEDLELSFLGQRSRKAYKQYSIFRNTPVLIQDLMHITLKRLFTSCNQTTPHPTASPKSIIYYNSEILSLQ